MAKKKAKKTGRYMVELDPEVAAIYQKLSKETEIPIVRLVNGFLLKTQPLVKIAVSEVMSEWKSVSKEVK
jgi:hypothetical protein